MAGDAAHAASCRAMKAELAKLSSAGNARFAKAAKRQRVQMVRTERLMRDYSCASRRSAACSTLRASYGEMKRNLRKLQRRSDDGSRTRRKRLKRRIAQRCDEFRSSDREMRARIAGRSGKKRVTNRKAKKRTSRTASKEKATVAATARRRGKTAPRGHGTFKTMCVRMCDGLAFPVSFSTTPRHFAQDAEACASLCPGVRTRLYAAPATKGTIADARDVETGEPYPDLSTAFRHRETYDRACTCRSNATAGLDYGRPVAKKKQTNAKPLKPAPSVRIVGPDYFRGG